MTEFKIGNWVLLTYSDGYTTTTLQKLIGISEDFYEFDHKVDGRHAAKIKFASIELWKPKTNEWCWFKSTEGFPHLAQFTGETFKDQMKVMYSSKDYLWVTELEPFTDKLPSFLKEQND